MLYRAEDSNKRRMQLLFQSNETTLLSEVSISSILGIRKKIHPFLGKKSKQVLKPILIWFFDCGMQIFTSIFFEISFQRFCLEFASFNWEYAETLRLIKLTHKVTRQHNGNIMVTLFWLAHETFISSSIN